MNKYRNAMEAIVVKKLDEVWGTLDCCKCDFCHDDIVAYALNQLPPKYVVSNTGELYARMSEMSSEQEFDILLAVARAIQIVSKNPRHER
jgi:competence protein ComFB